MRSELREHARRLSALERKVSELYRRLGQAEPSGSGVGFADAEAARSAEEDPRLLELLRAGKKIEAVKAYRDLTGLGVREAKEAVERLAALHRPGG